MQPVDAIDSSKHLLPPDSRQVIYTAPPSMPECLPLPTLVTPTGQVVMQFKPDPGELALLAHGVPITIVLWSGGQVAPIAVSVGGVDLR